MDVSIPVGLRFAALVCLAYGTVGCGGPLDCPGGGAVNTDLENGEPLFMWGDAPGDSATLFNEGIKVWEISCRDGSSGCIRSPLAYGEVPNGAEEDNPAEGLLLGVVYNITITLTCEDPPEENSGPGFATGTFELEMTGG